MIDGAATFRARTCIDTPPRLPLYMGIIEIAMPEYIDAFCPDVRTARAEG